ncbi:MAG: hypothetical protein AMXMBFR61_22540 [Fimbriimonadales bacterium]
MLNLYVMLSLSKHDPEHRTLLASDTTIAASAVMLSLSKHEPEHRTVPTSNTTIAASAVMLSLSKHDPEHRALPTSDTTIAARAVMLPQAQHDGFRRPGCGASFPVTLPLQEDASVANRHGEPDVTPSPVVMVS